MPIQFEPASWQRSWNPRWQIDNEIQCAILAAGLGRRMDPLSKHHLPKPLFPLGGKVAMAEVWVRRMVESGILDVSMNLCVHKETIERYFGDGAKLGANIRYVEEDIPSGTLGGVCKQALGAAARQVRAGEAMSIQPAFRGTTVIAPSGDIVTNFGAALLEEMYELHKQAGAAFTMILVPVPWERRKDYGTVVLDRPESRPGILSQAGRIADFREKDPDSPSNLNNASIYMIELDLLKGLDPLRTEARRDVPNPFYDFGQHVFPAMLDRLPYAKLPKDHLLMGVQYDGAWFDVGQKRDYLRVNEYVLDGKLGVDLPYEKLPWGYLGSNVNIDFSRLTLHPPVVIGNDCIIGPNATLGPYAVIGDGWILEDRVRVHHSVLWERYSFFDEEGTETAVEERQLADRHVVRQGVTIAESIVAGGDITVDLSEQTADATAGGELSLLHIDSVPSGPRA